MPTTTPESPPESPALPLLLALPPAEAALVDDVRRVLGARSAREAVRVALLFTATELAQRGPALAR